MSWVDVTITAALMIPDWFGERGVSKITGDQLFEDAELYEDQLADLWEYLKRFQDLIHIDG